MTSKLALLVGTVALAGITYADSGSPSKVIPVSNGKGGIALMPVRPEPVTTIALAKSSRAATANLASERESDSVKVVPASSGKGNIALVRVRP